MVLFASSSPQARKRKGSEQKQRRRNREKLSLGSGVAQLVNDGRKEETERVHWEVHGVEAKTVEPDFRDLECLNDAMPGPFVLSGVAVFQELLGDISLLLGSENLTPMG